MRHSTQSIMWQIDDVTRHNYVLVTGIIQNIVHSLCDLGLVHIETALSSFTEKTHEFSKTFLYLCFSIMIVANGLLEFPTCTFLTNDREIIAV